MARSAFTSSQTLRARSASRQRGRARASDEDEFELAPFTSQRPTRESSPSGNKFLQESTKSGVYGARAVEFLPQDDGGELERHDFGTFGVLGMACTLTSVFTTILATLSTSLTSGGPVLMIWGLFIAAAGALFLALSLGEMASAFPTSRGPMQWAYEFSAPAWKRPISYTTGHLNWIGYAIIASGYGVILASQVFACVVLYYPDFVVQPYMLFLVGQLFVLLASLFNIFGMRLMPALDKAALCFFFFAFFCYLTIPVACAWVLNGSLADPSFVFTSYINETGYDSINGGNFVAFMIGSSGIATSFGGVDSVTHIAEECERPEIIVPKAMWITPLIGVSTSFTVLISLLFAVVDLDGILATPTGVPYVQLLYNATQSKSGTVCLTLLIVMILFVGQIALMLTASRIAFTVARDGGFITPTYFARVSPRWQVPIRVTIFTSCTSAAFLCTVLGSSFALNSFLNSVLLLLWSCYGICIVALLRNKRRYVVQGPFQLGKAGWVINVLALFYMSFQVIFFVFPYTLPAEVHTMNYSSLVYVGLIGIVSLSWCTTGNKYYLKTGSHNVVQ